MMGLPVIDLKGGQTHPMDRFVRIIVDSIKNSLSADKVGTLESRIAFGALETSELNAFIIRSECSQYFAILINYGLVLFVYAHARLMTAWGYPEKVLQWNGRQNKPTRTEMASVIRDMVDEYKRTHRVAAPFVRFEDAPTEIGAFSTFITACMFAICHELGHFYNGDLDRGDLFAHVSPAHLESFAPNPSHLMEHAADTTGFELLMQAKQRPENESLLFEVGNFFSLLKDLGVETSDSHPAPHDRVVHLAERHFSHELAEGMGAYYRGDASLLEQYSSSRGRDWRIRSKP